MLNIVISEIKQIAKKYSAGIEVDEHDSGDYIDCILNKKNIDIYIVVTRFKDDYFAYSFTSSLLPGELYSDSIKNANFTEKDRSEEIIKNTELLLSGNGTFYAKPSFLNRKRGYIVLEIDGKERKIFQKSNVLGFKAQK